jgi:hypothetical protein
MRALLHFRTHNGRYFHSHPLVSKVNNPPHLADFAAHRDCSAVEAAPAARRVPPAGALGTLRLPRGNKGTIGHEENTSRVPRIRPF